MSKIEYYYNESDPWKLQGLEIIPRVPSRRPYDNPKNPGLYMLGMYIYQENDKYYEFFTGFELYPTYDKHGNLYGLNLTPERCRSTGYDISLTKSSDGATSSCFHLCRADDFLKKIEPFLKERAITVAAITKAMVERRAARVSTENHATPLSGGNFADELKGITKGKETIADERKAAAQALDDRLRILRGAEVSEEQQRLQYGAKRCLERIQTLIREKAQAGEYSQSLSDGKKTITVELCMRDSYYVWTDDCLHIEKKRIDGFFGGDKYKYKITIKPFARELYRRVEALANECGISCCGYCIKIEEDEAYHPHRTATSKRIIRGDSSMSHVCSEKRDAVCDFAIKASITF